MDVPATLLHLYGVPIPQDYDGRVLVECLAAELQACPVQWQPGDPAHDETGTHAFSVEETAQLTAHLKALGYLA